MAKLRVFISSTMNDLKEERKAVAAAVSQNRSWESVYAESFVAKSESPRQVCLEEIRKSHIYIGIFKNQYGYIPAENNPQGCSVVKIEYIEAKRNQLPILIFIAEDSSNREKRLNEFLSEITDFNQGHWRKEYTTTEELVQLVLEAINDKLVREYGGKNNAERKAKISEIYKLPYFEGLKTKINNNYIDRKLLKREEYYQGGEYFPSSEESFFDLDTLIAEGTKRIVLLSDAGYGKSTELKAVTCKFKEEENQDFIPIFIELDTYVDEEMTDYVKGKIGEESKSLLDYDKSKLVFLFDEFDQVINKEIAVRKIKNFTEKYAKSTFIIACRTNFYSGQFENWDIFNLLPFSSEDIQEYTQKLLNQDRDVFLTQLNKQLLFDLAKNPFFLTHLIKIYQRDKKIPVKRSDIFSKIISLALQNDEKKFADKDDSRQEYPLSEIKKDLMYISLVMETLQKNFVTISEFNKIISDKKKRRIIAELSLIKKSFFKNGDVYQFQHNNFQEYLAAEILVKNSLNDILKFISFPISLNWVITIKKLVEEYIDYNRFGIKISKIIVKILGLFKYNKKNKIIPSWVNVTAFLCQLRAKDDFLKYLMNNDPELALKFETNRIDENKRVKLFKKIFEKYTDRKIWIDRNIDHEKLADFTKTKEIYDYLMNFAHSKKHFTHRYNAIQILGRMENLADESLRRLLIRYVLDEKENLNVRHQCFYALGRLKMATPDTMDALKELKNSNNDWILSGFYYLIKESKYTDRYVDILLEGIPKTRLRTNSTKTRLVDESWYLVQGIEKVSSIEGIRKIINYFIENPQDFEIFWIERAMKKIVNNIIEAYKEDNTIYNEVKKLIRSVDEEYGYRKKDISIFQIFFQNTGTAFKFVKELYAEGIDNNYSLLAFVALIADEECIDFLLQEYRNNKFSKNNLLLFINCLHSWRGNDFDFSVKKIREEIGIPSPVSPRDYEKERRDKIKKEIQIIFDREELLKEIENIFNGEKKKELDYDDILRYSSTKKYNEFVVRELRFLFAKERKEKWTFNKLKEKIDQWNYKRFTFRQIFNLLYYGGNEIKLSIGQKSIIDNFCLENLKKVNFKEALVSKDKTTSAKNQLAVDLWYFLIKFNLKYPEDVLLDMLSFDWIEGTQFVGIDYLENKLPTEKMRERILENMNKEIKANQVLKNHINYCKKYKIQEARDCLYGIVKDPKIEMGNRLLALETVVNFPDCRAFLEEILDIKELKLFTKAAKILVTQNNKKCKEKLIHKLSSKDENFFLESAKLLIEQQNLEAIRCYADFITRKKKFEYRKGILQKINTIKVLPSLFKLLKFSYEYGREIQQDRFDTLDREVINVLKNIALQDYSKFNKVIKELQKFIKKESSRFDNVNFLNVECDNIEKAFFINYKSEITIDEAINKTKKYRTQI